MPNRARGAPPKEASGTGAALIVAGLAIACFVPALGYLDDGKLMAGWTLLSFAWLLGSGAVFAVRSVRERFRWGALAFILSVLIGSGLLAVGCLVARSQKPPPATRDLIASYKRVTSNYQNSYAAEVTIQTTVLMPHISLSIGCDQQITDAGVEQSGLTSFLVGKVSNYSADRKVYWFSYRSGFEPAVPLVVTLTSNHDIHPMWVAIGDARDRPASSPKYPIRPSIE